jgi:predicted Zn-dependent protease with MMP-like domain
MKRDWPRLLRMAEEEVRGTIRRLPPQLRPHAELLPVSYEPLPNASIQAEGWDPDLLGLFVGQAFGEAESGLADVPPQILLFLENLWDFAEEDEAVYREEIRTTYLHELGHYLGLDELDLEERGLD